MLLVETEAVAVGTIVTKSQAAAWAFICLKFLWLIARVGVGVTPISQLRRQLTGFQCGPCGPCHAPGGPQRPVPWPPLAMSTAVTGWAEPAASPAACRPTPLLGNQAVTCVGSGLDMLELRQSSLRSSLTQCQPCTPARAAGSALLGPVPACFGA